MFNTIRKWIRRLRKPKPTPSLFHQFREWRNRHPDVPRVEISSADYLKLITELAKRTAIMMSPPNGEPGIYLEGVIVQRNSTIASGFWER